MRRTKQGYIFISAIIICGLLVISSCTDEKEKTTFNHGEEVINDEEIINQSVNTEKDSNKIAHNNFSDDPVSDSIKNSELIKDFDEDTSRNILSSDPAYIENMYRRNQLNTDSLYRVFIKGIHNDNALNKYSSLGKIDTTNKVRLDSQKILANKLFDEISKTSKSNFDALKKLYKKIISECPNTNEAQIAYVRLANIFLYEENNSDYYSAIDLLEDFPADYPKSNRLYILLPMLVRAYEETDQWDKIISLYNYIMNSKNIALSEKDFVEHYYKYAQALEKLKFIDEAVRWYQKVVEKGKNSNFIVGVAKDKVAILQKRK